MIRKKIANSIEWDNELWDFFGIDDDIRDAWDKRFGEEFVSITLIALREYLKKRPDFEETNIEKYYGGNWAFWIYDCFKRNENWRKEREDDENE